MSTLHQSVRKAVCSEYACVQAPSCDQRSYLQEADDGEDNLRFDFQHVRTRLLVATPQPHTTWSHFVDIADASDEEFRRGVVFGDPFQLQLVQGCLPLARAHPRGRRHYGTKNHRLKSQQRFFGQNSCPANLCVASSRGRSCCKYPRGFRLNPQKPAESSFLTRKLSSAALHAPSGQGRRRRVSRRLPA